MDTILQKVSIEKFMVMFLESKVSMFKGEVPSSQRPLAGDGGHSFRGSPLAGGWRAQL